jgi:hypothetical protein
MASAITPHSMPYRKDAKVPLVIRNDKPIPNVVKRTELRMIDLVDGNAIRLIIL